MPGSPRYEALPPQDRYKWAREAVLVEQEKEVPDLDLLTDLHAELRYQRAEATLADPLWDLTHNITIADKEGRPVLFAPYPVQQQLLTKLHAAQAEDRHVRWLIPKARRHGVSAVIGVEYYRFVARGEGRRAMVVAHNDEDAVTLFDEKYLFTHRTDPLAPRAARSSVGELYFPEINGRITVRSAYGRRGVGHGGGYHALHLSEASRYPETEEGYHLITGLIEAVPKPPLFSMVVVESTGYGQQGWFYEESMRALRGEGGFEVIFLPWFRRHDAVKWFCKHEAEKHEECACLDAREARAKFQLSLDETERLLKDEYELPLERLHWRRFVYEEDIKAASETERRRLLKQEHPATVMECFLSTGASAFNLDLVDKAALKARAPIFVGDITSPRPLRDRRGGIEEVTPRPHLRVKSGGPMSYWARPRSLHRYCIGVDLAQGKAKGDFSVAMVYDRDERRFVARYRARVGSKEMHDAVRLLSRWYNDAIINPEDNFAPDFIDDLKHTDRRQHLYWRINPERSAVSSEFRKLFGWNTNVKTKKFLVHMTQGILENDPFVFSDPMLLDEMRIFPQELNQRGDVIYPGVPPNVEQYDDVLMAAMLALVADQDMPLRGSGPSKPDEAKPRSVEDRWNEMIDGYAEQRADAMSHLEDY
jgi:hypothetical protein